MHDRARHVAVLFLFLAAPVPGAVAQNLVQNPGFEFGFNSWTPLATPGYTVGWDSVQGNEAPGAASLDVAPTGGPTDFIFLNQCVPATGVTTYDVGGSFRYPSSVGAVPVGSVLVRSYSDAACTFSLPGIADLGLSSFMHPADVWHTQYVPKMVTTPVGTVAVQLSLRLRTNAAGATFGWFDDILLVRSRLAFFAIEPCRVVDTRDLGAPIGGPAVVAHEPRPFTITGKCGLPLGVRAVSANIVATQGAQAGNVRLYAADSGLPESSNVNYDAGQTRANNAVIPLDQFGALKAFVSQDAGTTVHLIIDVNGYFR